jgi:hypothetical protein
MLVALYILMEEEASRLKRARQGGLAVPLHDGSRLSQSRRQGGVAPASRVHDLRLAVTSLLSSIQSVKIDGWERQSRAPSLSLGRRGWSWHARRLYLRCSSYSPSHKRKYTTNIHYYYYHHDSEYHHGDSHNKDHVLDTLAGCLQLSRARHDKTRHPATLTGLRARPRSPPPASTYSIHFNPTHSPDRTFQGSPLPCTSQPYCNPLLPYPFITTTEIACTADTSTSAQTTNLCDRIQA